MPDSRRSIPLRPTAPALSEREQSILRLVVQRFVQTAAPVGSRVISEEDEIVLSSASIRNTMSRLEALGYLGHPHTSAGRVPTELGYRFYVDSLMNVAGLTPGDEAILRQSLDALYGDIEALTRTSSRLLGQLSQLLGVVLTPKLATGTLDRIDVVPLSSSRVMFVLEVRGGLVRTIIAEADAEPEFQDPEVVRGLIRMGEDGEAGVHLLEADPVEPGDEDASAIVLIGRELTTDLTGDAIAAPDYAVVTAPYRVGDTSGRVGVSGPTRMDYGRAVALVERVASLLSRSAA